MSEKYYAHTREEFLDPCDWQLLEDHLKNVAELAANFTETFESRSWGWLAGLWHDLGKYQPEFQARLRGEQTRVEHSGLGAAHAFGKNKINGLPLAFVIAGHHAGLANLIGSGQGQPNAIIDRVKSNQKSLKELLSFIPKCLLDKPFPVSPPFISLSADLSQKETKVNLRRCEFWIRFLFSALVDADRLDTEYFVDKQQNRLRGGFETIGRLKEKLDAFLKDKIAGMSPDIRNTQVNKMRAGVLANCLQAAESDPGVFSLTVPTGGGKTLSAMAFALKHAECNGLRRVIVVIPYTSIIEQNAQQYRLALGTENIIEHHSNFDIEAYKKRHGEEDTLRMELATENWDAPVIVTTTVQFFESLFSNKPSQCRKLHNVAGSVIILDEVQTLPPEYLISVLEALNELIEHYGCSVVLSTATPPALAVRKGFEWGLKNVREIVVDADDLACKLGRVDYTWPDPDSPPVTWEALAKELSQYEQVLAVVHRRDDAREVAERLRSLTANKPVFHLSALMCPAHRVDVLAQVKDNLHAGEPCLLVSTQLVEAGVDLDFPVVYRALGGLDSMVQAAGRCNREGRLDRGRVIIFRAPSKPPSGTPSKAMNIAEGILRKGGGRLDVATPHIFDEYFRSLYLGSELDAKRIQSLRQELKYADVAREFRLIEDGFTRSVVTPYKQARARVEDLRTRGPCRDILRSLQPFVVSIYPKAFLELSLSGALEEVVEGVFVLSPAFNHLYTSYYGMTVGNEITPNPGGLII